MKKHFSSFLILLSLVFVIYYLKSKSLLDFSIFRLNSYFLLSLFFLFLGFVISGLSWWYSLRIHFVYISALDGIRTHGLPIFAKYIPGKIWTVLGKASKVSEISKNKIGFLSFISFKEQLIFLLTGILISIIPLYFIYGLSYFFLIVLFSALGFYLLIFNKLIHSLALYVIKKIIKKELNIPLISNYNGFKLSIFNLILWFSWTIAFYFFGKSFQDVFPFQLAFVFPISVVYGVLAIIMPGGIGVREGIIATYLNISSLNLETATTIAVASRLWFISGEIFIFLLSFFLSKVKPKS